MKTSATVSINREDKHIVIYVNDGDWSKVPDLSFIADVDVHNVATTEKNSKKGGFFQWILKKKESWY